MYFRGETSKPPIQPISIVGAALEFPGAADPAMFCEHVISGRRMFREEAHQGGDSPVAGGACLTGDSSPSARHLLAARTAAAALNDVLAAGRPRGSRTEAIIAAAAGSGAAPGQPDITRWVRDRLALGLPGGPMLPGAPPLLDTEAPLSCSLRAIALACDLLTAGPADLVLAGGVSTGADPGLTYRDHRGGLAEDMRIYDTSPSGARPGAGAGMVALMRAADAAAAGLPVYAEIASWHAVSDTTAHSAAIRGAYERAGIDPAGVQYIEGHGAATAIEDLSELTALLDVLGPADCSLGSVAANLGNAGAAAGVAAVLKTALAMTAGVIPPSTGCVRPHQLLRTGAAPFRLPGHPTPWPDTNVRLAAVNSLGAPEGQGGLRSGPVHLVLRRERKLGRQGDRRRRAPAAVWRDAPDAATVPPRPRVSPETMGPAVPASAAMPSGAKGETVIAVAGADRTDLAVTLDTVALTAERMSESELHEFALSLASGPAVAAGRARAAIVAANSGQLIRRARAAAAELRENPGARTAGPGVYLSPAGAAGRVVLLFPGLATTAIEHSAVLSASMATLDIVERIGVRPQAAVGYSFGEIAALAWAGAMTFGEAGRLAAHRPEVIRATPGYGAMARVLAGPATVSRLLAGTNLALAAQEGPGQHVLAGPVCDIRALPRRAAELDVDVDVLPGDRALHCPAMRPTGAPMRAALENVRFTAPGRRVISAVTGLDVTGPADAAELVAGQLARPVLLAGALALACADADLLLVTARDPALARVAGTDRLPVVQAPLDQRPGAMMPALAAFFAAGAIDSVASQLADGYLAARA